MYGAYPSNKMAKPCAELRAIAGCMLHDAARLSATSGSGQHLSEDSEERGYCSIMVLIRPAAFFVAESALEMMVEITEGYLCNIATRAQSFAELCGRSHVSISDLERSFAVLGKLVLERV